MTYYRSQALLAIPMGRLWRLLPAPAVQGRSHGSRWLQQDGGEFHRIPKNKTPAAKALPGFSFLEAWR